MFPRHLSIPRGIQAAALNLQRHAARGELPQVILEEPRDRAAGKRGATDTWMVVLYSEPSEAHIAKLATGSKFALC